MVRKIGGVVLAVALPFLLEATNGCALNRAGLACDEPDCLRSPDNSHLNSYVCSCSCAPAKRSRMLRVSASTDDAEELTNDGSVLLAGLDLAIGTDAVARVVGVRFRDVGIPQGSTILNAHVQFTASAPGSLVVTFAIAGEAADDAAPFGATVHDLTMRQVTAHSVDWTPTGWIVGDSGPDEATPNLAAILQDIVDRSGWAEGNALVLLISTKIGAGVRHAHSYDGKPPSAPLLVVEYQEPTVSMVGPQDLPVCVLPGSNPNIPGGAVPTDAQLAADCENRVEGTLTGLADACGYPSQCECSLKPESRRFSDTCDKTCVLNPVDMDCTNFDPVFTGNTTATNAPGGQPVCLANSPLAFGIFGRRTACNVSGTAHVEIEGEGADPSAAGILQFRGDACPGEPCAVGMEYRLDIGTVTFESLFSSETFEELAGLGESVAGQDAVLSASGDGMFGSAQVGLSARGVREGEQRALVTANDDVVNLNVSFGSMGPTCALSGALVGSADPEIKRCESGGNTCTDDSDCADDDECSEVGDSQLLLNLNVGGSIVNQPPTADAGADQTVECPAPAVLDASASSDLDSNITLFSWRRSSRTGPEVGFEEITNVQQGLGMETYILRVIDAFGQTDEDPTKVTVVDTTPPQLSCSVAIPVLQPTNHNLVDVGLASRARDVCEGELPVMVSVFGDEDDEEQTGDGNFSPDARNIAVDSLRLRAERKGNGDGRVYLILVEATDSSGNRGINCCTVIVPHSRAQSALQSAQEQAAAAQAFCLANAGTAPAGYVTIGDGTIIGPKQ